MGTGSFPGVKSGRGVTLTTHPLLLPWSRKSRATPLLPLWAVRPVQSLSACTRMHLRTGWTSDRGDGGSIPGSGKRFFSIPKRHDRVWIPLRHVFNEKCGLFPRGQVTGMWSCTLKLSSTEDKNQWSYGYTPPYAFRVFTGTTLGTAVVQWLRCCAANRKVAASIPAGVSGFFIDKIFPIALWPWGPLSL